MNKEALKQRIQKWATRMSVSTKEIHIRAMNSKWASVSTDGRLTMDSSILELRDGLCDYIIVHELFTCADQQENPANIISRSCRL